MNLKKDYSKKQRLILKQKTKMKLVVAVGSIIALSLILLIYFNITRVEEMKANQNTNQIMMEKPVDLNVTQIKIAQQDSAQNGKKYKIAKPLSTANQQN